MKAAAVLKVGDIFQFNSMTLSRNDSFQQVYPPSYAIPKFREVIILRMCFQLYEQKRQTKCVPNAPCMDSLPTLAEKKTANIGKYSLPLAAKNRIPNLWPPTWIGLRFQRKTTPWNPRKSFEKWYRKYRKGFQEISYIEMVRHCNYLFFFSRFNKNRLSLLFWLEGFFYTRPFFATTYQPFLREEVSKWWLCCLFQMGFQCNFTTST